MRRKVISCVICALMIATVLVVEVPKDVSAQVTEEWVARYNGPINSTDSAIDLVIGPSGNIYVTGTSWVDEKSTDYNTIAYDPDGNLIWSTRYDGCVAHAMTIDSSENVFVTGLNYSSATHFDIATVSYDSSGNERWVAIYNGPANYSDRAWAITTDYLGHIYIAGESSDIGKGDNYVTIKYDPLGNELWVARYNGSETSTSHRAFAIAVDCSGNVYVSGEGWYGSWGGAVIKYDPFGKEMWVRTYYVGGVGGGQGLALDPFGNVYVSAGSNTIKYDTDGNVMWSAEYNGTGSGWLLGKAMAVDSLGNVYVSGYGKGLGAHQDYVTVKYDQNGDELWWASYNGPGNDQDRAYVMALDSSGNVYVAGESYGSGTKHDYATIKYDSSGNELWVARYNGPGNRYDSIQGIALDSIGNIYVTGKSYESPHKSGYLTIKYSQEPSHIQATIDIDPNTLNLKSKGRWITCYIDLPSYNVNDVDISTVLLEDIIPAEWGDIQGDTLMVKFDRSDVEDMLSPGTYNLKVTGELKDGTEFEGYSDEIRVIEPP